MNSADDELEIMKTFSAESAAWLRRDINAIAEHWVHSPQARRMVSLAQLGTQVQHGWDAIFANFKNMAKQFPDSFADNRVQHENMNIVVNGNSAWVTYDQVGDKSDDNFEMTGTQHELKIFQRVDGRWKIICIVVMLRAVDHEICPLIEIALDKKVLWLNDFAHERISDHPALFMSGGRLRVRNRIHEEAFEDAIAWASRLLRSHLPPGLGSRLSRAVVLGESENATPILCWLLIEDGKLLVSFDDDQRLKRKIAIAREIYGLTTSQAQLGEILASGNDLKIASKKLGVTLNTVKTHLQRMFDKTGVRSQSALVATLFSVDTPN